MHGSVQGLIEREKLLHPGMPILVGVSGGPDSLALMDILDRLGYQLVIAHLNHGLRSEAEVEAREVHRMAQARSIPIALDKIDVGEYAEKHSLSIEEAARTVRYQFLFQQAKRYQAQAVAVGHTADDQVETVIMHLLRGSGLAGLRGMQFRTLPNNWSYEIPLVRPLLAFWRDEVLAYCQQQQLKPQFDRTNLDVTYFRNRLRHEMIPYLEKYNPAIKEIFWRMSLVLGGDHQVLEGVVEDVWRDCIVTQGDGFVTLDPSALKDQFVGVQRGIFRKAISILRPGLRNIDFNSIERAVDFLDCPTQTRQIDLIAGLYLFIENGRLILADWQADLPCEEWPQIYVGEDIPLEVPGKFKLGNGWFIRTEMVSDLDEARKQAIKNIDSFKAWISMDHTQMFLKLRSRKPGDRFQPLGMEGHSVKLSEYMINQKIPRRVRERWPLIVSGNDIVWIPGIALSHQFRLAESTRQAAFIKLHKKANIPRR